MKAENDYFIIISCEHRGNQVPADFKHLFKNETGILDTHEGFDIGVKEVYNCFKKNIKAEYFYNDVSRLLIETNRSIDHPQLFSRFVLGESEELKNFLLYTFYFPYRSSVEKIIEKKSKSKKVLHLSLHTFTPVFNGEKRDVDIGLLFDESNTDEFEFCRKWQLYLKKLLPGFNTILNKPYNGADDGFTTYLRKKYSARYLGIEIEINQKYAGRKEIEIIAKGIIEALNQTMNRNGLIYS